MRVAASINGQRKVIASLEGSGHLGAHLNVRAGSEIADPPKLKLIAYGYSDSPDTIVSEWPLIDVAIGDKVELTILESGPADSPEKQRRTSKDPGGLFVSADLAARVSTEAQAVRNRLLAFIQEVDASEPLEEAMAFKNAVGSVVYEIFERLLSPIWRRHSHLIPDDWKGQAL